MRHYLVSNHKIPTRTVSGISMILARPISLTQLGFIIADHFEMTNVKINQLRLRQRRVYSKTSKRSAMSSEMITGIALQPDGSWTSRRLLTRSFSLLSGCWIAGSIGLCRLVWHDGRRMELMILCMSNIENTESHGENISRNMRWSSMKRSIKKKGLLHGRDTTGDTTWATRSFRHWFNIDIVISDTRKRQ